MQKPSKQASKQFKVTPHYLASYTYHKETNLSHSVRIFFSIKFSSKTHSYATKYLVMKKQQFDRLYPCTAPIPNILQQD